MSTLIINQVVKAVYSLMKDKFFKFNYFITLLFTCIPFLGFASRGNFLKLHNLDMPLILNSLRVSLLTSVISICFVIILGIPAGYYIGRNNFKYKSQLNIIFSLPQVLPPAVIGLLLLITYGHNGFIGRYLSLIGIQTSFSMLAVVLTFIFVSLPIFIKGVSVVFSEIDPKLEQTALLLGDSPIQVFRKITFPLANKGILVALIMSWSRGISEFGATMMFAGNLQGVTQTLPLAIYTALQSNINNALFLAFIMFVISIIMLIFIHILIERRN